MKKFFALSIFMWAFFQTNAQTVTDTSYYSYPDSAYITIHDSVPDSTVGQRIAHVFAPLSTDLVTTGILINRSIPLADYRVHRGDTTDSVSTFSTVLGLLQTMNMGAIDTSSPPFTLLNAYNGSVAGDTTGGYDPIGVLAAAYNQIDSFAVDSGLMTETGRQTPKIPSICSTTYSALLKWK